ncbi:Murein hydrolase activator NlpD [Candidatus Magnetaquicoccaceae bacterium FCR-1]|uniref:Murein hydrolase activator NlpD n=1 Tax=Candidatus Magnetaquiglobus chichijimensis TaxID=3141448 RepID=A0ABQ0CCM3_9PROT
MRHEFRHRLADINTARAVGMLLFSLWIGGCTGTGALPPATDSTPVRIEQGPPLPQKEEIAPARPVGKSDPDRFYIVKPKETLWSIAAAHKVDVATLAAWNGLSKWQKLQVGQRLRVVAPNPNDDARKTSEYEKPPLPTKPDAIGAAPKPADAPDRPVDAEANAPTNAVPKSADTPTNAIPKAAESPSARIPPPALAIREKPAFPDLPSARDAAPESDGAQKNLSPNPPARWVWPHSGRIISRFGQFGARRNTGIDIAANPGDPVMAAADGVVAYADQGLATYGNMVLLRHGGAFMTTYAHVQKILVKQGQSVRAGETIALAGQSGVTVSPRLHFEIRRSIEPQNPLEYLPKRD